MTEEPVAGRALEIRIPAGEADLPGTLTVPAGAETIVVFAHGSGSSRHSPRNRYVANVLGERGLATLLFDLLTAAEERQDARTGTLRFEIGLLAARLLVATDWLLEGATTGHLRPAYFGASTGAAAALVAAAQRPDSIAAVVSRGGRPDLAGEWLARVRAPTLLIVGGRDEVVVELNERAQREIGGPTRLEIVPGATHLFEEPGALERVAELAAEWFLERG